MLVRRDGALTESGSGESAASEPNDLTVSAKWVPVIDGAAGEDDRRGLGESTVPKAIEPMKVSLADVTRADERCSLTLFDVHATADHHGALS